MPRAHRRRPGTDAEQISAGRRQLAAIDPAVMRRVVGRPQRGEADADPRSAALAAAGRRTGAPDVTSAVRCELGRTSS